LLHALRRFSQLGVTAVASAIMNFGSVWRLISSATAMVPDAVRAQELMNIGI